MSDTFYDIFYLVAAILMVLIGFGFGAVLFFAAREAAKEKQNKKAR